MNSNAPYNTGIFIDIENLTKGYGISPKVVKGLSIKEIIRLILDTEKTGRIAVHKAYANWFNPKLSFLFNDLVDLDIEPITVFGTHGGNLRNVSDIRLCIDVMEVLHTHPDITCYVIISGDGAYANLVHQLHQYGKTVIGCAYKNATNKMFSAVCDHFIWIEDPELENELINIRVADTRNMHLIDKMKDNGEPDNNNLIWIKINDLIQKISRSKEYKKSLEQGINPSVIRELLDATIPNFDPATLGYDRFIDFLVHATKKTDLSVYFTPPSNFKVGFKGFKPTGSVAMQNKNDDKNKGSDFTLKDERIKRLIRDVKPLDARSAPTEVNEKMKEIIGWMSTDIEFRHSFIEGVNPSTIDCAIKEVITGYSYKPLGFNRFSDLLCSLLQNTELCLAQSKTNSSNWRVFLKEKLPESFTEYVIEKNVLQESEKPIALWDQIPPTKESSPSLLTQLASKFKTLHK